jgi:hypothetical protein
MCVLSPLVVEESESSLIKKLKNTLTLEQQNTYERIKRERMGIHMRGYGIGLLISALVLMYKFQFYSKSLTPTAMACITASITFTVNYYYYILSPKSEWMIQSLEGADQKEAWIKMYRHMQFNYHVGFLLGIVAVFFMTKGIC